MFYQFENQQLKPKKYNLFFQNVTNGCIMILKFYSFILLFCFHLTSLASVFTLHNSLKERPVLKLLKANYQEDASPIGESFGINFEILVQCKKRKIGSITFDSLQFENKTLLIDKTNVGRQDDCKIKILVKYKEKQKRAVEESNRIIRLSPFLKAKKYEKAKLFYTYKGITQFFIIESFQPNHSFDIRR